MRLTKETLKKIIKEELEPIINEVRIAPDMGEVPEIHRNKIHSLIDAGEHAQAQSFVDAFGGDPNYVDNYLEYQRVGDIEKLGTKAVELDNKGYNDAMTKAFEIAHERTNAMHPDLASGRFEHFTDLNRRANTMNTHTDRFFDVYNSQLDKRIGSGNLKEGLMYEGDNSVLSLFEGATLQEGGNVCGACLFEQLQEASCGCPDLMGEAEYQGRKVTLNKPMRGDVKKFKVYVKDPKTGNVKKVNFGDPNMKIKKSNPKRRKSFRARHNCDNPGPKTKARYWSCKKW